MDRTLLSSRTAWGSRALVFVAPHWRVGTPPIIVRYFCPPVLILRFARALCVIPERSLATRTPPEPIALVRFLLSAMSDYRCIWSDYQPSLCVTVCALDWLYPHSRARRMASWVYLDFLRRYPWLYYSVLAPIIRRFRPYLRKWNCPVVNAV